MPKPKFYITTAIPYANGAPHIGHAYERIATDAIARFKRLDGYDVLFVTGMDEHGQKMQQTAAREGLTPQQLADLRQSRLQINDSINPAAAFPTEINREYYPTRKNRYCNFDR